MKKPISSDTMTTGEWALPLRDYPNVQKLVFCVGAQKASTSWLAAQISDDERCWIPGLKELHFWNNARSKTPRRILLRKRRAGELRALRRLAGSLLRPKEARINLVRLRQAQARRSACLDGSVQNYIRLLMTGYSGQQIVADMTPDYALLGAQTFREMADLHPGTRFVFVMRDPVERLWSGLRHHHRHYGGRGADARVALDAALNRALTETQNLHYLRSRYDLTVRELEAAVSRDQILYLFYETMREPRERERISEFLGLDDLEWKIHNRVNAATDTSAGPDRDAWSRARAALEPAYAFAAERFPDALPNAWRQLDTR